MRFADAVLASAPLAGRLEPGLAALAKIHRSACQCDSRRIQGSVNLDEALIAPHPNDPRWDYAVGLAQPRSPDYVAFIEAHPASSTHVNEMLAKLAWLKTWLRSDAPDLDRLPRRFFWLATGAVSIRPNTPQARRLAQAGLAGPSKYLRLD